MTSTCIAYLSAVEYRPNGDGTTDAVGLVAMVEIEAPTCRDAEEILVELWEDGLIEFVWQETEDGVTRIPTHVAAGRTPPCLDLIDGPDGSYNVDDFLPPREA